MRPAEGLLPVAERTRLVELARARGGDVTGKRNPDGSLSPYELNLNYFDAVSDAAAGEPPAHEAARFMLSQAVALCLAGFPGIYIHSLLGSRGDREGVRRTGRARSINRAQLRTAELAAELADPGSLRARVFPAYLRLLELRREQPAFHPDAGQEIPELGDGVFAVRRRCPRSGQEILALHSLLSRPQSVETRGLLPAAGAVDLLAGERLGGAVPLDAFQFRWLTASP
jgi:sucrose phosphorylase